MYDKTYRIVVILKQPDMIRKIEEQSATLRVSRTDLIKIAIADYLNGGGSHK